jgi:hypothetical protein
MRNKIGKETISQTARFSQVAGNLKDKQTILEEKETFRHRVNRQTLAHIDVDKDGEGTH